jgi:hypothetical protein
MSTRINDFLYELIKSLTKSEKRYFKLLSSRHTIGDENNYVVLFDFLDKLEEYDEKEVFAHFKGEAFLNRFSITKKRLYNHILSALDSFHSQANIEAQLHKMLHGADILIQKTLYAQASKLLHSAEKLASKNELHSIMIDVRKKVKILQEKNNYLDVSEENLLETFQQDEIVHEQSIFEDRLWNIKSRLLQKMTLFGQVRTPENETEFTSIYQEYIQLNPPLIPSLEAKYMCYQIESAYHFALQNYTASFHAMEKNLNLFRENDHLILQHPERYFSLLTNLIYTTDSLGNFDQSQAYLTTLQEFVKVAETLTNIDLKVKLFSTISSINLTFSTRRGRYQDAIDYISEVEKGLILYEDKISNTRRAFLNFKIASIYLSVGENSKALKTIRKILNDTALDNKEDIVSFAHLLELLIHIEREDYDYLPYASKSTQRFLKKRNRLYPFEEALLAFSKKFGNVSNKFEAIEKWEGLLKSLLDLSKDPYQATALEYFDFISWAEAKAKEMSFLEICQSKFDQQMKKAG